jgi:hypothetical protein
MMRIDGQDSPSKHNEKSTNELDQELEIVRSRANGSQRPQSMHIPVDLVASMRSEPRWVGTIKIARILDLHPRTLTALREERELPAVMFGKRWKYFLPSVATWLEGRSATFNQSHRYHDQGSSAEEGNCRGAPSIDASVLQNSRRKCRCG